GGPGPVGPAPADAAGRLVVGARGRGRDGGRPGRGGAGRGVRRPVVEPGRGGRRGGGGRRSRLVEGPRGLVVRHGRQGRPARDDGRRLPRRRRARGLARATPSAVGR